MGEWVRYERRVRDLVAATEESGAHEISGEPGWTPLSGPLPERIRSAADGIADTPAIVWDLDGLRERARWLESAFGKHGITLNLAMKACSTFGVVSLLAELGLGCDVASPFEFEVARRAGFHEITACGPAFRPGHLEMLNASDAVVDVVSVHQARAFLAARETRRLGLRLRVPMPSALVSATTRGTDSRFGLVPTEALVSELRVRRDLITRLRVHTGETTLRTLTFRTAFALATAPLFDGVETINIGGGFLRLARRPEALHEALRRIAPLLDEPFRFTAEPGGALVLDHAYLVTEVLELDEHPTRGRMVTVDASAWNCAPWTKTAFHAPRNDGTDHDVTVVGPSLYELDAFSRYSGDQRHRLPLGRCAPGDRLVGTSFGAYTLTNGRSFNGLPLPAEYALFGDEVIRMHGPMSFTERQATPTMT